MSSSSPLTFYQSHPLQHKPDHRGKVYVGYAVSQSNNESRAL